MYTSLQTLVWHLGTWPPKMLIFSTYSRMRQKSGNASLHKSWTWIRNRFPSRGTKLTYPTKWEIENHYIELSLGKSISGWWFQPTWKILVKLDHFPKFRGEHKKYLKPPTRFPWKVIFCVKMEDLLTSCFGGWKASCGPCWNHGILWLES